MTLNKFSSPGEVKAHYDGETWAIAVHMDRFYPNVSTQGLNESKLENKLNEQITTAMETL